MPGTIEDIGNKVEDINKPYISLFSETCVWGGMGDSY